MATTLWTRGPARPLETFDSVNPATSEVIATFPVCGEDEVTEAVDHAQHAAAWWASLRRRTADPPAGLEIAHHPVHRAPGRARARRDRQAPRRRPTGDPARGRAHRLGRHARAPGAAARAGSAAAWWPSTRPPPLEYQPLGVVGVIGPWNYPVFTPMGSIAYALAAGNAVVFKPSEFTPAVGGWLVDSFAEVVPEQPVLQLVTGLGETGERLCRAVRSTRSPSPARRPRQEGDGRLRREPHADGRSSAAARTRSSSTPTPTSTPRPTPPSGARCPTPARPASASSGSTSPRTSTTRSCEKLTDAGRGLRRATTGEATTGR